MLTLPLERVALPPLERLTVPEERVALELLLVEAVRELRTVPLNPLLVALRELLLVGAAAADLAAERLAVTLRPVERLAPPRAENPLE